MNQEKFDSLVERFEDYARLHPGAYKFRVFLLAAFGYVYLFVVTAVLLAFCYLIIANGIINPVTIKVVWIPLALVGVVLQSLWVKFPEPDGCPLTDADAPALFDLVKEIERAVGAPRVHHILLTDQFNASIIQVPRLGVFGWQQNYLLVGLPLMQALSPEQFRAVIAHELGHLSGNHSRFAGWIYRVRQTWIQIMTRLQKQRRRGSFIFVKFINWYAPFFNAYSFVLARAQEREADLCAVQMAGKETMAAALINIEVKARFLSQEFWPKLLVRAGEQMDPPADGFTQMLEALKQQPASETTQRCFTQALAVRTNNEDTHPSLSDRLKAMGYIKASEKEAGLDESLCQIQTYAQRVEPTAADFYLGAQRERFAGSFNRAWKEQVKSGWQERYRFVQDAKEKLSALDEKAQGQTLSLDETWTRARLIAETRSFEEALPIIQEILALSPDHVGANFAQGQILLERGDEAGVQYIEKAMALDASIVIQGCELLYGFQMGRGRVAEAEKYRSRALQHYEAVEKAQYERRTIYPKDRFEPHGLSAAQLDILREQLSYDGDIRVAYLVKKVVQYFPEEPFYVLGIIPFYRWYQFRSAKKERELVRHLIKHLKVPGRTYVVALERNRKYLRRVFRNIKDAQIFTR